MDRPLHRPTVRGHLGPERPLCRRRAAQDLPRRPRPLPAPPRTEKPRPRRQPLQPPLTTRPARPPAVHHAHPQPDRQRIQPPRRNSGRPDRHPHRHPRQLRKPNREHLDTLPPSSTTSPTGSSQTARASTSAPCNESNAAQPPTPTTETAPSSPSSPPTPADKLVTWGIDPPKQPLEQIAAYLDHRDAHQTARHCPVCGDPVTRPRATTRARRPPIGCVEDDDSRFDGASSLVVELRSPKVRARVRLTPSACKALMPPAAQVETRAIVIRVTRKLGVECKKAEICLAPATECFLRSRS